MTDVVCIEKQEEAPVHGGDVNYCCEGCDKVIPEDHSRCVAYRDPAVMWRLGTCPLATHIKTTVAKTTKVRVGQQKQSKTI